MAIRKQWYYLSPNIVNIHEPPIMYDLVRDTVFSHTLRVLTGGKVFKYPEEEDSSLWKRYVHPEKSHNIAVHGDVNGPQGDSGERDEAGSDSQNNNDEPRRSSATAIEHHNVAHGTRKTTKVDPEKGKDYFIVDWYGPDDPEVSMMIWQRNICSITDTDST